MIVSHARKYVCIAIPKTGSCCLRNALLGRFDGIDYPPHHRTVFPPECHGYTTFTLVRNPYARALSIYRHARRTSHCGLRYIAQRLSITAFVKQLAMYDREEHYAKNRRRFHPAEFKSFCNTGLDCNQAKFLSGYPDITVLRLESLIDGFIQLPFVTDDERANQTNDNWKNPNADPGTFDNLPNNLQEIDSAFESAVYEWAAPDFRRFGYERFIAPSL